MIRVVLFSTRATKKSAMSTRLSSCVMRRVFFDAQMRCVPAKNRLESFNLLFVKVIKMSFLFTLSNYCQNKNNKQILLCESSGIFD